MAATNFTPIILYHTTTASAAPTAGNLNNGELAINITDGKLFYKDNGGTVQVIATKGTGTIGGSNTQVQYNSSGALAGSANFTFNGTTATINTLNLTNALGTAYGGTALTTYTQGDLVYASAANTLAKLGIGANTYILTSTGSVPQWSAPSAVTVATANNLAGGAAGSVPYQSGASTTTFLSIGSAGQVLTSSGTAPQWSNLSSLGVTSLSFGTTGLTPSTATQGAITVAGTLATTNGGTGLTSFTANGVMYASSSSALATGSALTFDGTTFGVTNASASLAFNATKSADGNVALFRRVGGTYNPGVFISLSDTVNNEVVFNSTYSTGNAPAFVWQNAASERMRLNDTGLGVGTNSPVDRLTIVKSTVDGASTATFINSGTPTTTTQSFRLRLGSFAGFIANPQLSPYVESLCTDVGNGYSALAFGTYGSSGVVERVRITSAGDVGIGTSSPTQRLSVAAASALVDITSTTGTNFNGVELKNTSGSFYIGQDNSAGSFYGSNSAYARSLYATGAYPMVFFTNATERMRLDSSGNLGIGTSSPAQKLDVSGIVNSSTEYRLNNSSYSRVAVIESTAGGFMGGYNLKNNSGTPTADSTGATFGYFYASDSVRFYANGSQAGGTAATERMRITSAGLVGVGISNPGQRLSVLGTANASYNAASAINVDYQSSSTGVTVPIGFSWSSSIGGQGAYWGMGMIPVSFASGSADLGFYTQAAERMRVTAGGNLLIGTTSDQNRKVQINGQLALIDSALNSIADIDIQTNGEFRIRPYNASGSVIIFGTSPSGGGVNERARIDSSGNLLVGTTTTVAGSNHIVVGSNAIQGTKNDFTNLGTTAQSFGFQATNAGAYIGHLVSVGGAKVSFILSTYFDNSGIYIYTTTLGGCTAGGTAQTISGINNDSRTYTFSRNGGTGLLEVTASSTATGTTTIYLTPLNVFG